MKKSLAKLGLVVNLQKLSGKGLSGIYLYKGQLRLGKLSHKAEGC